MTFDMTSWLKEQSITEVECLVSDIAGIPRGKILPVHKFSGAAGAGGLRLPEYVFGQSVTGAYQDSEVLNEIGADVILRPDPDSCRKGVSQNQQDAERRRNRHRAEQFLCRPCADMPSQLLEQIPGDAEPDHAMNRPFEEGGAWSEIE